MSADSLTVISPRMKLPSDAVIQFEGHPRALYLSMTLTRAEHVQALYATLETFARLLEQN
jgi:hypothetical protein